MSSKITLNFKRYFPSSKANWIKYLKTSVPVILAAMVFAFNSFVDNFMSTSIPGGNQALSYANTWTEIEIGIISLTTIVGSSIFAQYVGKEDVHKIKEVVSFRILFALFISLLFAIPAMAMPLQMVELISGFDRNMSENVKSGASNYLRIIAVSWVINAVSFTIAMILREKHHGLASFIASLISLVINVVLNSIFIFGLRYDIIFLAISTIISLVVSTTFAVCFIASKDRTILINPFKMFKISKTIWVQFGKRTPSFILLTAGSLAVTFRVLIWNLGYPTGSIGLREYRLSAAAVLGIAGMFFNIFWTTLESINANIAVFVGRELGNNHFEQAKKNAEELLGFHVTIAAIMGLLLFCVTWAIRYSSFFAHGFELDLIDYFTKNSSLTEKQYMPIVKQAGQELLKNIQYNLFPLCFNMPMFIWFITRNRVISAGGLTNLVSTIEMISGGLQLGFIALICYVFNNRETNSLSFAAAYSIFFISDWIKFVIYEIVYHKVKWQNNITNVEY